ncbi:HEPN domain-containing protein [Neomoorella thermoacetica]|uniref:HEPN domain-containing protein n=1 Tax=Neomoorella thermoacetica TaxID=1525 RepID=UPI0008FB4ABC|nr:HEPN domain-containing protein [Moorella thermoacetica]APC08776.1 HEPN domain protein [Moorella thermoacetica]
MCTEAGEWLKEAEYDLETAEAMHKAGRYGYTVFMCHLAIEKGLKAVLAERTGTIPPKIHNLIRLAKLAQVNLGDDKKEFISILNTAAIGTRYPEFLDQAIKRYSKKVALEYLNKTREVMQCLKIELQSRKL